MQKMPKNWKTEKRAKFKIINHTQICCKRQAKYKNEVQNLWFAVNKSNNKSINT